MEETSMPYSALMHVPTEKCDYPSQPRANPNPDFLPGRSCPGRGECGGSLTTCPGRPEDFGTDVKLMTRRCVELADAPAMGDSSGLCGLAAREKGK
jgi:hypothetical protein